MGNDRFDRIAKAIGRRTTRRLAIGAETLFLKFSALLRNVPLAEAAGSEFCRTLPTDQIISNNNCFRSESGGSGSECVCVQTPGHHVRCVARFDSPNDCPRKDECSERRTCGRGKFCAKVSKCCNNRSQRICLRPCPA